MPEEWDDTLGRMKSFGAQATEEQFNRIRSFLLRTFGKAKINAAPATDLAPILDVPPALAEAVVAHRRDNGPFKSLDRSQEGRRIGRGPGRRAQSAANVFLLRGLADSGRPARRQQHQFVVGVNVVDVLRREQLMLDEDGRRHRPAVQTYPSATAIISDPYFSGK